MQSKGALLLIVFCLAVLFAGSTHSAADIYISPEATLDYVNTPDPDYVGVYYPGQGGYFDWKKEPQTIKHLTCIQSVFQRATCYLYRENPYHD